MLLGQITPKQHFTEPPARYSDASIVKELEEYGIGRPSTYAPTISTVIDRGYVERLEQNRLSPTDIGVLVNDVLTKHFTNIIDYEFTARLEMDFDTISEGKHDWQSAIKKFYGPFKENLENKSETVKREDIIKKREIGIDPESGLPIIARIGRFGAYVQLGDWNEDGKKTNDIKPKMSSLEKGQSIDTLSLEEALERMLRMKRLSPMLVLMDLTLKLVEKLCLCQRIIVPRLSAWWNVKPLLNKRIRLMKKKQNR